MYFAILLLNDFSSDNSEFHSHIQSIHKSTLLLDWLTNMQVIFPLVSGMYSANCDTIKNILGNPLLRRESCATNVALQPAALLVIMMRVERLIYLDAAIESFSMLLIVT